LELSHLLHRPLLILTLMCYILWLVDFHFYYAMKILLFTFIQSPMFDFCKRLPLFYYLKA
jgi:hypothetical protein